MTRVKKKAKRFVPWTEQPPTHIYAAFTNDRLYHVSTELEYAQDAAAELPDGMAFKVFEYSRTPSPVARIEKVRKWCITACRNQKSEVAQVYTDDILAILNAKPGRKG